METRHGLRCIRHRSELGEWTLYRLRPNPVLRPFVRDIEGYYECGGIPLVRKELPTDIFPLVLVIGPGFIEHPMNGQPPRPLTSFFAGLSTRPSHVGSAGAAECLQINFTLSGAWRFLGIDMSEVTDRIVDLDDLLDREAADLECRLAETAGWPARLEHLELLLTRRMLDARPLDRVVATAVAVLERSRGAVSVSTLSKLAGCSRKHLAARFRQQVGLPPKTLTRILRFHTAIERLEHRQLSSLTDLAAACGYADQPHFNRDFRAFAGESPGALLKRMLPDGSGILADRA